MKYLVSTGMRVGSTWVGRMLGQILNNGKYDFIDKENIVDIETIPDRINILRANNYINNSTAGWVKSHVVLPSVSLGLININSRLKVINIRRDIKDALLSRFYYSKDLCRLMGDGKSDVLEILGDRVNKLTDKECIDYLLNNSDIFQRWAAHLKYFDIDINSEKYITLSYEKLCNKEEKEFDRFIKFCDSNISTQDLICKNSIDKYKKQEKEKFKERSGNAMFSRKGVIGEGEKMLKDLKI